MAIVKSSPNELAIHGGGPPAFASRLPAFSANVGEGPRFAQLAERMFMATEGEGSLAGEFETALSEWLSVRNVVGFSSLRAAVHCLNQTQLPGKVLAPSLGYALLTSEKPMIAIECEQASFGMSPAILAHELREDASCVFAINPLGRPCMIEDIEDVCDEWSVPLFLYGHQALGCRYHGARLGSFGRGEIFDLGRDQLIHAMDSAVIATDDDLLAHRLRVGRSSKDQGLDLAMSDAAAAMGIANLESADRFIAANRERYRQYRELLADTPGIKLLRHESDSTFQSIAIEVDARFAGLTRNALAEVLASENVGVSKPLDGSALSSTPVAYRLANTLLQLPTGPSATEEAIKAVSKLVELAIVRSLESPDPLHLAA